MIDATFQAGAHIHAIQRICARPANSKELLGQPLPATPEHVTVRAALIEQGDGDLDHSADPRTAPLTTDGGWRALLLPGGTSR